MRPLRAYLAGAWVDAQRLDGVRQQLEAVGIHVTSRWLSRALAGVPYTGLEQPGDFEQEARRDYHDIDKSDFLLIDTFGASRGGREWEGGYATGQGKRVVRVGPVITPFHAVVNLSFPDWAACVAYFATAMEVADVRNN